LQAYAAWHKTPQVVVRYAAKPGLAKRLDTLSRSYSTVEFMLNQEQESSQGYYSGVRFQMYARDPAGTDYFIVDGGFTDWTQQLLSNRKERLLISGVGSERFVSLFG